MNLQEAKAEIRRLRREKDRLQTSLEEALHALRAEQARPTTTTFAPSPWPTWPTWSPWWCDTDSPHTPGVWIQPVIGDASTPVIRIQPSPDVLIGGGALGGLTGTLYAS